MIDTETWKVGIYCRLSREDELEDESKSITNQREMCMNWCRKSIRLMCVTCFEQYGKLIVGIIVVI